MRIAVIMSARQTGHPAATSDTRTTQSSQNRACPHGAIDKPARDATRKTWQQSSEVDPAPAVDASDAESEHYIYIPMNNARNIRQTIKPSRPSVVIPCGRPLKDSTPVTHALQNVHEITTMLVFLRVLLFTRDSRNCYSAS